MTTELRVELAMHVRPLDPPAPAWCEEHALPCALVQHFVVSWNVAGEAESPIAVIRAEGHS